MTARISLIREKTRGHRPRLQKKYKELIMDYSCFSNMIFERRDPGILWITLSKPEKLNTADASMHQAFADLWPMVDKDPETRCVWWTGSVRAFSAGVYLASMR